MKQSLRPYSDVWQQPSGGDVQAVLSHAELTTTEAASIVGVAERTIRKWTREERSIPYAAWALLVEYAGLGKIWG